MAKLRVSELTKTGNVTGTDLVYIVQGINSRATTVANLFLASNVIQAGPPGPPGPQGEQGQQGPQGEGGLDASPVKRFTITANNQANAYFLSGKGFEDDIATQNPPLYFHRGFDYELTNISVDENPLVIKYSSNGNIFSSSEYFTITSELDGLGNIEIIFLTVPFSAPSTLYYQSNTNPQLGNVIYII